MEDVQDNEDGVMLGSGICEENIAIIEPVDGRECACAYNYADMESSCTMYIEHPRRCLSTTP